MLLALEPRLRLSSSAMERNSLSQTRASRSPRLESMLTCPKCSHQATEIMPTDACQFFYDCKGCGERLKPKPGDLLRILLLRLRAMSADAGGPLLLLRAVATFRCLHPSIRRRIALET